MERGGGFSHRSSARLTDHLRSSCGDLTPDQLGDHQHLDRPLTTPPPGRANGEIPGVPSTVTTAATSTPEGEGRGQHERLNQANLAAVLREGAESGDAVPGERKGDRRDKNASPGGAPGSTSHPADKRASIGKMEPLLPPPSTTTGMSATKGHEDGGVSPGRRKKKGGEGGGGGGAGGKDHEMRRGSLTSSETSSDDFLLGERRPVSPEHVRWTITLAVRSSAVLLV